MKTSAQDSVVSARTLQRHGHTVSVINDGIKFLMNFRAYTLASTPGRIFAFTSDLAKIGVLLVKNRPGVEAKPNPYTNLW